MSIDLVVFAERSAMPSTQAWARAIVDAGFPAQLDHDFDVDTFSGYLPCPYGGGDSGFEYLAGAPEYPDVELPREFDFSVTFSTHSDMRELAASIAAAATLCSLVSGVLYDPQAGETVAARDAIQWARDSLAEIEL